MCKSVSKNFIDSSFLRKWFIILSFRLPLFSFLQILLLMFINLSLVRHKDWGLKSWENRIKTIFQIARNYLQSKTKARNITNYLAQHSSVHANVACYNCRLHNPELCLAKWYLWTNREKSMSWQGFLLKQTS